MTAERSDLEIRLREQRVRLSALQNAHTALNTAREQHKASDALLKQHQTALTASRVKDYLDLWVMLDRESLNMNTLAQAISATFTRRGMAVPTDLPMGLSDEFAADPSRQTLWTAFVKKNDLAMIPLADVVARIRSALEPAIGLAARTPRT